MRLFSTGWFRFFISVLFALAVLPAYAVISVPTAGFSYTQNFNGLATSGTANAWTNDSTLPGWSLFTKDSNAITAYVAGDGSTNTGGFYSFGTGTATERALGGTASGGAYFGSPASGSLAGYIAVAFTNNSGSTISGFTVAFNGEQWRNGGNATAQSMVMQYGFGATMSSVTTWVTPGGNFDWTSPVATATAAAVDGNAAGRVAGRGGNVTATWGAGQTLWIRWIENNDAGNDHGLAIDDFSLTVGGGSTVVNGTCGTSNNQTLTSAPTTNLCTSGVASAVAGSGPWTWSCTGSGGGTNASCSANKSTANPFTIYHMNDVHARVTPHKWLIPTHGNTNPVFEDVGGAAYVAGKMLSLVSSNPTALVLDGGDISEGNPVGDMNGLNADGTAGPNISTTTYGNGGLTGYYSLLANKLKNVAGRGGRGVDAMVVGNHDVRDISYITNMEAMHAASGIPVISANIRDISTHQPHFPATTMLTVNGTKIGIIGYTTPSAVVGSSLANSIEVVECGWNSTPANSTAHPTNTTNPCHMADYVNDLRNNQHCDVVILLTHDGHSDLVDPAGPVLADTADAKVPEIAVTGHWHTYAETVWQPTALNYKTIFAESASYMKYIGELNVDGAGKYVSATQHVLRNADITPDPDVQTYVNNLIAAYNANAAHPVNEVVGYTNDDLKLDDYMKWWSADEYPWSGNNTAGQWITDGMKWKCDQIWGASGTNQGGCDLAVEAGGGVRADIPAGPVTWKNVYETFPWADDTYYRINMTGQDILNFLKATNLDAGFSDDMDVTANDGIVTSVTIHGQPLDVNQTYKVAINNYMYDHPPGGYTWTDAAPLTSTELVRESLADFMRQVHPTSATAYTVGGDRYHFNGQYSGGYRAVVTMMNDNDTKLTFDDAFIRFLSANPETLARRGTKQVPSDLVNTDGSINTANRFSEQELYRSYLGFKTGALKPGDIIEVWGKSSFYGGNPEFVDQEGIYGDGIEFKIVGHDESLAKPTFVPSIAALLTDNYKNHYVKFLAKKSATANSVTDQFGQTLKIWDVTGFAAKTLPGNTGDTLEITGVLTMESYGFRLRGNTAVVTTTAMPAVSAVSSHVDPLQPEVSAPITLSATASISNAGYTLSPIADAQVASGNPTTNYGVCVGTSTSCNNMFIQSSSVSSFGNERGWLKFDLSSIPAGSTITGATLQLWNWKSTGASLPVEVRSASDDSWTESGLTWNTQPTIGGILDTKTLAASTTNVLYSWNVGSFVQNEFAGDKTVSLLVKPVIEGSADATAPSYGFDAKEFGSNGPVLVVTTNTTASSVGNVKFFYRYSADNAAWGAWTQTGATDAVAPYSTAFSFPNGFGYYEFYSVAVDNLNVSESTPAYAQAAVHYQVASGTAQTISFTPPVSLPVSSVISLSATATSGLPVTLTSLTSSVCSVTGNNVSTLAVGNCNIKADQAGDAGYWQAATTTQSIAVTGLTQTISFSAISNVALGSAPFAVTLTASSGLPVTLASLTPAVCTVNGATVTLVAEGNCSLQATQAGNSSYSAATAVTQSFTVTTATQVVADGDAPLPAWMLWMLGAGLFGAMRSRMSRQNG